MPNSIEIMLDHILFLARKFNISDVKYIAKIIVLELGVSPKHDGYRYLFQGIALYVEAPVQLSIKSLYSALAALYNGTVEAEQIEQSIRSAINGAWKKHDSEVWGCYFPSDAGGNISKPSNGEFISTVACVVDLWKGWCCEYEKSSYQKEESR